MKEFFEGIGALFLGLFAVVIVYFFLVCLYASLLLLIYYMGYFASYIFVYFVPEIKSIHFANLDIHHIFGLIVMLSMMISTSWDKFGIYLKK